jgi:hypothetical protein
MGPFLLRNERRKRVGWLRDQYVNARALYPDADTFCFIGHSNGTYLAANAMLECEAIKFDRVVFAGSVVRPDYPWQKLLRQPPAGTGQVKRVLNYVATADWVVASVPRAMQYLRFVDLGAAGHLGFVPLEQPSVRQVRWVPGQHSAALAEQHWNEIADFALLGRASEENAVTDADATSSLATAQNAKIVRLSRLSWLILVLAVLLAGLLLWWAVWLLAHLGSPLWLSAVSLLLLLWIVGRTLTRV